jgi:hypothetical protein
VGKTVVDTAGTVQADGGAVTWPKLAIYGECTCQAMRMSCSEAIY